MTRGTHRVHEGEDYDDAEQNRALELEKFERDQYDGDIKWLMSHKQGRRIVHEILKRGKVFQTTFRLNSEMQFLEGHRNLALSIQADIFRLDLEEQYLLMLKEAKEWQKLQQQVRQK